MGDEQQGVPVRSQAGKDPKEGFHLVGNQDLRRLIEHQNLSLSQEKLEEFHPLLLANRQLPHRNVGIQIQPVAMARLGDGPLEVPGPENRGSLDMNRATFSATVRAGTRVNP